MPTATPVLPAWQRTSSAAENTNEKGAAPENTNQKEAASSSAGDSPEITFSANQAPGESEQLDLTDQSEANHRLDTGTMFRRTFDIRACDSKQMHVL